MDFENERNNLLHQLQLAKARADSESLARSIAEEIVADLEKDKAMKEIEISNKDLLLSSFKKKETEYKKIFDALLHKNNEYDSHMKSFIEEIKNIQNQAVVYENRIQQLTKQVQQEHLLKLQAVNKLAEIMNRKDWSGKKNKSFSETDDCLLSLFTRR